MLMRMPGREEKVSSGGTTLRRQGATRGAEGRVIDVAGFHSPVNRPLGHDEKGINELGIILREKEERKCRRRCRRRRAAELGID